jgi:hypothetical protein
MTEESNDGAEDGDDGDGHGDGDGERVMVRVFFLFGELDAFGHFVGASFRCFVLKDYLTELAGE